jgi:Tol biopolymer transport system component
MKGFDGGAPSRFTTEGIENRRPSWSRDGEYVTFIQSDAQGREIRQKRAVGAGDAMTLPTGLVPGDLGQSKQPSEAVLSGSGEWLVYRAGSTDDNSDPDIFALRIGVDSLARELLVEEYVEWAPALSPDGMWLAYASTESGRSEVYVRPFPGVDARQERISFSGGDNPIWSRSGRELFYRDETDQLVAVDVTLNPTFSVGRQTALFSASDFLRGDGHPMYDVTADAQRFVMLARVPSIGLGELVLVRNWLEELSQMVPPG